MIILGIETSCDETSASLVRAEKKDQKVELITNVVSSSLALHAKTGGIIPEIAAREQVKYIIPVIKKSMEGLKNPREEIDAIAVTTGPGLIGSLLVGVETAKTISYIWDKPIVPVNHLFGHIYANWIENGNSEKINFPVTALIVSGGHTDLVLIKNHREIVWLGGTRDDAAGEAFDKTGRILGLSYPAGPQIEKLASGIKKDVFNFPRPLIDSGEFDFSFSGLKTAVVRKAEEIGAKNLNEDVLKNISFSIQEAIFEVLIKKTITAAVKTHSRSIVLGGGVAANQTLRNKFEFKIENLKLKIPLFVPEKRLCTDNAAMIAAASFFNYKQEPWKNLTADPEAYFD